MSLDSDKVMQRLDAPATRIDEPRGALGAEGCDPKNAADAGRSLLVTLVDEISGLVSLSTPSESDLRSTLECFKRYLTDGKHRIRLHDLLVREVRLLRSLADDGHTTVRNVHRLEVEDYLTQLGHYETIAAPLVRVMATGGYWADGEQARLLSRCVSRLSDPPGDRSDHAVLANLRGYPGLLLAYAFGIGAVLAGRYESLATLLSLTRVRKDNKQVPLVRALAQNEVLNGDILKNRPELAQRKTPASDHLFDLLKQPMEDQCIDDDEYQRAFDRFEYLFALVHADHYEKEGPGGRAWGPIGCFLWRRGVLDEVSQEIEEQAEAWPPLRAGLFSGSVERLRHLKGQIDGIVHRSG